MQRRERVVDLAEDAVQLVLGNGGVAAQRIQEGPLAVELLQEVALEVRAAADFEDLEHAGEARVMGVRMRLAEEELHPVVQVFQPQERSYALVEGVFVGNHGPRLGMAAIVADAAAFSQ